MNNIHNGVVIGTMHYWSLKRCIIIRANLQQSS